MLSVFVYDVSIYFGHYYYVHVLCKIIKCTSIHLYYALDNLNDIEMQVLNHGEVN